jgi:hypothetical protein
MPTITTKNNGDSVVKFSAYERRCFEAVFRSLRLISKHFHSEPIAARAESGHEHLDAVLNFFDDKPADPK